MFLFTLMTHGPPTSLVERLYSQQDWSCDTWIWIADEQRPGRLSRQLVCKVGCLPLSSSCPPSSPSSSSLLTERNGIKDTRALQLVCTPWAFLQGWNTHTHRYTHVNTGSIISVLLAGSCDTRWLWLVTADQETLACLQMMLLWFCLSFGNFFQNLVTAKVFSCLRQEIQ